jgi:hypothetical protein
MGTRHEPQSAAESGQVKEPTLECDACGKRIEGEPAGHGLYLWTRGDEVRYEEPPLCSQCANAIGLAALAQWELEEDGD